ncbi:hypothetical protein F53441_10182 [Fusarium austroafricanum]|uniref:Fucose-specific lectin n=1 Tax=Fusarium austroafricanum TaxID=2364996 RepID=A0A8H4NVQ4_9HYPO|nr:hypothetical protein F53441_10182 [Fusarium austroafricanum]
MADEKLKKQASIFYQSDNGAIINGYYECDPSSGKLIRKGEYGISEIAQLSSVHKYTGLSVELLGSTLGYRVFYHDAKRVVRALSYTVQTDWIDAGFVSQDPAEGMTLESLHWGKGNITVAFSRGSDNLEVARLEGDGLYHLVAESLPKSMNGTFTNETSADEIQIKTSTPGFTLPSWDATTVSVATSIDSSRSRSIFYIGTDKKLYQVTDQGGEWDMASNQSASLWPTADDASARLAVAYQQSQGEIWVYYRANGTMIQAHRDGSGYWDKASALPTEMTKASDGGLKGGDDSSSKGGSNGDESRSGSSGLSTGAKAGVGVGAGVGGLVVIALAWLWLRRRSARSNLQGYQPTATNSKPDEQMATGYQTATPIHTPLPEYKRVEPAMMDSQTHPVELASPTMVYEMPGQNTK